MNGPALHDIVAQPRQICGPAFAIGNHSPVHEVYPQVVHVWLRLWTIFGHIQKTDRISTATLRSIQHPKCPINRSVQLQACWLVCDSGKLMVPVRIRKKRLPTGSRCIS